VSPGLDGPHPAFGTPLPPGGRGGGGEGWGSRPTAYAVGYTLPPAPRAQFFKELLTHDASLSVADLKVPAARSALLSNSSIMEFLL